MRNSQLILLILCLSWLTPGQADESLQTPQAEDNTTPGLFGDTQFPPFSGMLFAGTAGNSANPNDTFNGISLIDPATGTVIFNAPNIQTWGAAADPLSRRVFFSVSSNSIGSLGGDELFVLSYDGGTPESLGVILDPLGEPLRMDGLAVVAGQLYAALDGAPGGGDPDGLYRINLDSKVSELVVSFTGIGGLDADPVSGRLFGTNDDELVLVEIDIAAGTVTDLIAYPEGISDIDGLAGAADLLYLVSDEDQPIQRFDLTSNDFSITLPSPFITADTFSGAALAAEAPVVKEFVPPSVPALNGWGMLLLSTSLLLIAIAARRFFQA